jgi:hypothetical protein
MEEGEERCQVCGQPLPVGRYVSCDADSYAILISLQRRELRALKGEGRAGK